MNLDQIEDLIRRYLAAGVAIVVILIAPATGGAADTTPGSDEAGNGQIDIIENDPPGEADPPAGATPPTGENDGTDPSDGAEEGDSPDAPSGEDPADEEPADEDSGTVDPGEDGADDAATDEDAAGAGADDDPAPGAGDPGSDAGSGDEESDDSRDQADDPADSSTGDDAGTDSGTDSESETGGETGPGDDADDPSTGTGAGDGTADDDVADESADDSAADDPAGDDVAITDDRAGADPDVDPPATDPDLEARGPADGDEPGLSDDPDATDDPGSSDSAAPPAADGPAPGTAGDEAAGEGDTAAERFGWGTPAQSEDFTSTRLTGWTAYEGPGHAGQGQRSPDAITVRDGVLTITGDARGTTGGLCWGAGQEYGRWEGRVRAPAGDPSYNPLLLLWPDAENFPVGGEIDFMEMLDPTRRTVDFFLHFGEDNDQVHSQVEVDGTAWHNWAVEWTPEAVTGYVDGVEWFRSTDPTTFPPGPMHLCVQLDWFPEGDAEVQESSMEVAWVRQYAVDEAATLAPASAGSGVLERMFSWG